MHKQHQASKRRRSTTSTKDSLEGTVYVSSVYRNRPEEADVAAAASHLPGAVPSSSEPSRRPKQMAKSQRLRGEIVAPVDTNFVALIYDKLSGNIYSRVDLEEADAWRRKRRALRDTMLRDAFQTPAPPPTPREQEESDESGIVHTPFATCDEKVYQRGSHFSLKVSSEEEKPLLKKRMEKGRMKNTLVSRRNNRNKTKLDRKNWIKEEVNPGISPLADTTCKNNENQEAGDSTVDKSQNKEKDLEENYTVQKNHTSSRTSVLKNEGLRKEVKSAEETLLRPKETPKNEGNPQRRESCQNIELPEEVTRTGKPIFVRQKVLKMEQNLLNSEEEEVARKQVDFTCTVYDRPHLLESSEISLKKDISTFREKVSSTCKAKRVSFRVENIKNFRESIAIRDKALDYQVYEGGRTRKQGNTFGEKMTVGRIGPCSEDGHHLAREEMNWLRRLWQKFVREITIPRSQVDLQ